MEYYSQTSLDEYYTLDEHLEEETVGEPDTKPSKCNYCVLKDVKKYIFHPGSIFLYVKDGELKALADIDHVYHKCREGLIDNIGFLYNMMCELKSNGYNVVAIGKAFDDDLYIYVRGEVEEDTVKYYGLDVRVINSGIEEFEEMNYYMDRVDGIIVCEAFDHLLEYAKKAER